MPEEANLIRDVLAGDAMAFERLIKRYEKMIGRIIYRMVSIEQDRQEIAQDVYLTIYQRLDRFRFESKLSTWIARIAYFKCVNYYKKKGGAQALSQWEDLDESQLKNTHQWNDTPEQSMMAGQRHEYLQNAISKLPPKYRLVLGLYHFDQMTYQEIGEVLKMPDGTVKNYLFRARKLLKGMIEKDFNNGQF